MIEFVFGCLFGAALGAIWGFTVGRKERNWTVKR